jgi:hypothetical protein
MGAFLSSRQRTSSPDTDRSGVARRASSVELVEGRLGRGEEVLVRAMTALGVLGFVVAGACGASGKIEGRAYVLVAMLSAVTVFVGIACASRPRSS